MHNVFERSKVRYIIGWVVLALIVSFFIPDLFDEYNTLINLSIIVYLIPIWWFIRQLKRSGQSLSYFFQKPRPVKTRTLVASAIMPVIFAAGMLMFVSVLILFLFPDSGNMVLPNQEPISLGFLIFNVIYLVIIAPFCEEIIFRGFLLGRMTYKFGVNKGIIFSSFIFGALHFSNVFGATMVGLILCVLYKKSNSLITTIIVHAAYNSVVAGAQIFTYLDSGSSGVEPISSPPLMPILTGGSICTILSLLWIVPFLRKHWHRQPSITFPNPTVEQ
jgi:membrane protease YdiL (CAAX protease family)